MASLLKIEPLDLFDVDPDDPPLAALRLAAGRPTTDMAVPGMSVMTYVRLEDGRSSSEPQAEVVSNLAALLRVEEPVVRSAIRRSRRDTETAVLLQ
jgi:hypothetical protein